jgi:hypothetical protein
VGPEPLTSDGFRRSYAERISADDSTLGELAVLDAAETITRDVERLRSAVAISPRVAVSGHVYDVVTGLVETVIPAGIGTTSVRRLRGLAGATLGRARLARADDSPLVRTRP